MKHFTIIKLLALTVFLTICSKSFSQTTQEEYNYVTKGYKVQIESGLDMKKGYSFVDYGNWGLEFGIQNRQCEFKGLVKAGATKPCAIMMVYKRTDIKDGATWYICIPSSDAPAELWQQTLDFINGNFKDNTALTSTIIWALMKFSSQEVGK